MMVTIIEEQYTRRDGEVLTTLHNISVLPPRGQNFDNPSTAVKGIVRPSSISTIARWLISTFLVSSPGLIGRTRTFGDNSGFC